MKTEKKNLRRISIVVTAQTKGNLERLAAVCGYSVSLLLMHSLFEFADHTMHVVHGIIQISKQIPYSLPAAET